MNKPGTQIIDELIRVRKERDKYAEALDNIIDAITLRQPIDVIKQLAVKARDE